MAFNPKTARPVKGGFNPATARPVNQRGFAGKAWGALAVPEAKSREGLDLIANSIPKYSAQVPGALASLVAAPVMGLAAPLAPAIGAAVGERVLPSSNEPTGNENIDIAMATPRIAAESLAETAPSFISRGAIVTAGALKGAQMAAPLVKMGGGAIGAGLERLSGVKALKGGGALKTAYSDPSLMLSKGKEAAQPYYEAAQNAIPQGANLFEGMWKPEQIVEKAQDILSKGGKIEPAEGLTARKAIDNLLKSGRYVKDELYKLRDTFDGIAKSSEDIAKADPLYRRGLQAQALRHILPQNANGTPAAIKTGILKYTGGMGAPFLSPAIQGMGATAAGLVGRYGVGPLINNPMAGLAFPAIKKAIRR